MPNIGPMEIVGLLLLALLLFGAKRLPEIGRSLGSGMREFKDSVSGDKKPEHQDPSTAKVSNVIDALGAAGAAISDDIYPPVFIDGREFDPLRFVPCRNGLLDLTTGELKPSTPALFAIHGVECDYDPNAECPDTQKYVASLELDEKSIRLLQEWLGYVLTPDDRQQKGLALLNDNYTSSVDDN